MSISPNLPPHEPLPPISSQPAESRAPVDPQKEMDEIRRELARLPTGNSAEDDKIIKDAMKRLDALAKDPDVEDHQSIQDALDALNHLGFHYEQIWVKDDQGNWHKHTVKIYYYDKQNIEAAKEALEFWPRPPTR